MPEIPDIRGQTIAQKDFSDDLLEVMKEAALERKQMVRAQTQDNLFIDPVTGDSYKMTPITITRDTPGVVLTDGVSGKLSPVFEYPVPEGAELLLPPSKGDYYMIGQLLTDDGTGAPPIPIQYFPVQIVVVNAMKRKTIGIAFAGTVDDINGGQAARQRGYGTGYNGEFPVRAKNGDVIQFKAFSDMTVIGPGGITAQVRWFRLAGPSAGQPLSYIALRAAMLSKVR